MKHKKIDLFLWAMICIIGIIALAYLWFVVIIINGFLEITEYEFSHFVGLLVIISPIFFFPWLYYLDKKVKEREEKYWTELAKLHQLKPTLNLQKKMYKLEGTVNNRTLKINKKYMPLTNDKTKKVIHTRLIIPLYRAQKHTLSLRKEDDLSRLMKRLGKNKDILIDEKNFDNQYIIHSNEPNFPKQLLTRELKQELQIVLSGFEGKLYIKEKEIGYQEAGVIDTEEKLEHYHAMISILIKMAAQLRNIK